MIQSDLSFLSDPLETHIPVHLIREADYPKWLEGQPSGIQTQLARAGIKGTPESCAVLLDQNGEPAFVLCIIHTPVEIYDLAHAVAAIEKAFGSEQFENISFELEAEGLTNVEMDHALAGWALGRYQFLQYKHKPSLKPKLVSKGQHPRAEAYAQSLILVRDLVNMPSNNLGPDELEKAVKDVGKIHKAKVKVIKDQDLLKENFPLVYAVGMASPRRPRLIELNWGDEDHPKVALVGKGVCFDTGGLNLKPTQYMAQMKKDMGGSAHTLALAHLIMALKLPVRLQLVIPAVENSVAGESFRPGDIFPSRKGLYVENTNTDAEGRLILADALTFASESKPEIIIDYATLTGSARAGLGPDIPALLSNDEEVGDEIRKFGFAKGDPVWPMPLWQPYRKHIEKSTGDLVNSAGLPGDLIYSGLFLESFLDDDYKGAWVHLDCYAWEHSGRPGRPVGGADTGLRAVFAYLEKRYGESSE